MFGYDPYNPDFWNWHWREFRNERDEREDEPWDEYEPDDKEPINGAYAD